MKLNDINNNIYIDNINIEIIGFMPVYDEITQKEFYIVNGIDTLKYICNSMIIDNVNNKILFTKETDRIITRRLTTSEIVL